MTNKQIEAVAVTQSARDVAADIWRDYVAKIGECIVEKSIRKGGIDDSNIVHAFAAAERRGMIAAITAMPDRYAAGVADERARVVGWLRETPCGMVHGSQTEWVAQAIEAGDHLK